MRDCMEKVMNLMFAKAPCIWIETYEEFEVENDLREILIQFPGMKLKSWTETEGLKEIPLCEEEKIKPADNTVGVDSLFELIKIAQDNKSTKESCIWLLKDFHLINQAHDLIRVIRDLKENPSTNYNPIIVVSPIVQIPIEHEKLFQLIEYDLPDKELISLIINNTVEILKKAQNNGKNYKPPKEKAIENIIDACKGLTINQIDLTLKKSMVKFKTLCLDSIMEEKIQLVKKSGVLDFKLPKIKFKDIGGNEDFKDWFKEMELSMTNEAIQFGCKKPKGYVAVGIPGCAKTASAEAIANKLGVPLLILNMSKIFDRFVGNSEKKIDQAFKIAKACSPCVLLMDEVEKTFGGARSSNSTDAGTTNRVLASTLNFMQENEDVFIVMTSNDITQLPPEFTRSLRIEKIWYFGLPTFEERKEIFNIHFDKNNKKIKPELIEFAAKKSQNFTGAEIEQSVINTIRKTFKRFKADNNSNILEEDIEKAIKDVVPIFKSSKEKIAVLEHWAEGRAKRTSTEKVMNEFDNNQDGDIIDDIIKIKNFRKER